jgi:hypothetical protein
MEEISLLSQSFRHSDFFVSRRIAEEAVLVPLRQQKGGNDHIYSLNETAASAWVLLDGSRTLGSVVEQIVAEYDVEESEAVQEVLGLVQELVNLGALEKV